MNKEWKSRLEKAAVKVNQMSDLGEGKTLIFTELAQTKMDDRAKKIILDNVYKIDQLLGLQRYICNSLLFFEGMSTGGYNKRKK